MVLRVDMELIYKTHQPISMAKDRHSSATHIRVSNKEPNKVGERERDLSQTYVWVFLNYRKYP